MKKTDRTLIADVKKASVQLAGWVHEQRDIGKIRFLILKDISGIIQITALKDKTDKKTYELMKTIPRESVIAIKGKVKASKKAPGGKEILPEKIEILAKAKHPLPIDTSDFSKTELPKRLDYRFLDLHRKKIQAVFKIQSTISSVFRKYFIDKGFIEIQTPSIISSASEGGTELFSVNYFEKKAFLAQSPQLYKQMLACSMEKVMTITPVWRAEKHNTIRHINESRQMDIEAAFEDQFSIMKYLEDVVKEIVKEVIKQNKKELELLKVKLKIPKAKYLSYAETIKLLKKHMKTSEGEDLSPEAEKKLDELYPDTILFVHSWPKELKPFYIMPSSDGKNTEGFDAIYKGMEISSGGQRVHLPELLEKQLRDKGLNLKNFKYYIDSFRFGAPSHAGWSIGLERFTTVLLNLDNIREATLFPRDRDRLVP